MDSDASGVNRESSGATRASLELLYHVSREFAAALDLRTVLQRVLFLSMKTVGALSGSIIVVDDQGKAIESAIITGTKIHNQTTQRLRVTLERGLAGWVARSKQAALITDTSQDSRWIARQPITSSEENIGQPTEAKSVVSAPLLVRDRLVGVMTLANNLPGYFTSDHLDLVQAIADQAGIAVLNARLYAESQRQARVMTALAESAAAINVSLNLEDVLIQILDQISQALRVEAVSLALIDPHKDELVFRAAIGWLNDNQIHKRLKLGQGIAGWVAIEGRGAVVPDVTEDKRYDSEIEERTCLKAKAIACAPIRSRGQVIGVLEALNPQGDGFDPDALLVLSGIGSLAGSAIRHAQLYESLQAAHQRYRELFEDSIEPILITDWKGEITEANRQAAQTSEYELEQLRSMTIDQLHRIDWKLVGKDFKKLKTGATVSYESFMHIRDGKIIPIQVYAREVKIDHLSHLQWILRDITERKNLDSLREDLLSMVYHDLRSPLANVVSSLDAINSILPAEEDPTLKSLVGIAMRSTERIQRLTNSLLDINRLEAGQTILNPQPVDVLSTIQEAIEIVLPSAQNKDIKIEFTSTGEMPPVSGDMDMIRRVFTNLFENAIKFTPPHGSMSIGGERDKDWLKLWVEDTGPGIPEAERERIFEKFARISTRHKSQGLGLGLTFCRLAIEGHGGRIWVESDHKTGSRFIFTLPILKD
jgi:two-component system, NtrC family, sensor histidine kinase KinB